MQTYPYHCLLMKYRRLARTSWQANCTLQAWGVNADNKYTYDDRTLKHALLYINCQKRMLFIEDYLIAWLQYTHSGWRIVHLQHVFYLSIIHPIDETASFLKKRVAGSGRILWTPILIINLHLLCTVIISNSMTFAILTSLTFSSYWSIYPDGWHVFAHIQAAVKHVL